MPLYRDSAPADQCLKGPVQILSSVILLPSQCPLYMEETGPTAEV